MFPDFLARNQEGTRTYLLTVRFVPMMRPVSSPFFNQAETHTFSDWLIPSIYGVGVENLDEYYIGAFPDLSEFWDRRQRRLHREVFDRIHAGPLQPLGKKLKRIVPGRTWIDLGCGQPEVSFVPRLVAHALKASAYCGVDLEISEASELFESFQTSRKMPVQYIQSDVLEYLKSCQPSGPKIFYMAGLELRDPQSESAKTYTMAFMRELVARLSPGDFVLVGAGCPELELQGFDLKKVYGDYYHSLWKRRNSPWRLFKNLLKF